MSFTLLVVYSFTFDFSLESQSNLMRYLLLSIALRNIGRYYVCMLELLSILQICMNTKKYTRKQTMTISLKKRANKKIIRTP